MRWSPLGSGLGAPSRGSKPDTWPCKFCLVTTLSVLYTVNETRLFFKLCARPHLLSLLTLPCRTRSPRAGDSLASCRVRVCSRFFFSWPLLLTPTPSWHQAFLTGYPWAPVCDLISYGMKGFCRKTGHLVRQALQAPSAGKECPLSCSDSCFRRSDGPESPRAPRAWVVTQPRTQGGGGKEKSEEGSFRIHSGV